MENHSHGLGAPIQIRSDRPRSKNPADFSPISKSEEQWRYLDASKLNGLDQQLSPFTGQLAGAELISKESAKVGSIGLPEDLVAARVWQVPDSVRFVSLGHQQELTLDINTDEDSQSLQLFIETEKHSSSKLILNHTGTGNLASLVEVSVGDESTLTLISVQNMSEQSALTSSQFIRVGRGATINHIVVSISGQTVRVVPSVSFSGPGGSANLSGAYFAGPGQYIEHRPFIDHNEPQCTSDVSYKGALQGATAHTVWVGDVLIRKAAEGTKTYELNRNLLLTDGARADSVPNLEIETGQIEGAGHASASGRFDDEQLFYLQARGISEADAKKLVVKGFLNDVISKIGNENLEEQLNQEIAEKLEKDGK